MKSATKFIIYIILCPLPAVCFGQAKMTTNDCVGIAVAHNRALLISQQGVNGASGRVKAAKGAGNAKINLFGSSADRSDSLEIPIAVAVDPNQNLIFQNVPLIPTAASSAGVSVLQPIDASGMIRTGVRVARLAERAARLDVARTRNDVVLQTELACYDVLRSEALGDVAEEAVRNAEIRKKTAQAMVDTGISSKVDVVRAEAAISAAQQSVITARNAVEITKSVLNRIMGRDVNASIELEKPAETPPQSVSYETCLSEALANRPEVAMASTNTAVSLQRYKLAGLGMSPTVALGASARIDRAIDLPEDNNASIGLSATFPIFDGDETRGRRKEAAAAISSSMIAEEDVRAQVALQVKNAHVNLQNSTEKMATANKELNHATEALRLSRSRYEQGIANQVELSDAELAFTQAQTNVVNACYEHLGSQAELEQALGRYAK